MKNLKSKKQARIQYKNIREEVIFIKQELILIQVKQFLDNLSKDNSSNYIIGIYWPLQGEVDLRSLINYQGISLALPACNNKGEITYHKWTDKPLVKDSFGIPAPLSEPPLNPDFAS